MHTANDVAARLYQTVSLLSRETDQILQEQLGIGLSQYKILTVLQKSPRMQQTIAKKLGQTEASVSRQIKLLRRQGMLTVNKNPQNRRKHIVNLTNSGSQVIVTAEKTLSMYHRTFFANLDTAEGQKLYKLLNILQKH